MVTLVDDVLENRYTLGDRSMILAAAIALLHEASDYAAYARAVELIWRITLENERARWKS